MALQYVGGNTNTGTSATYSVDLTALSGGIATAAAAGDLVIVITTMGLSTNGDPGVTTSGYTEIVDIAGNDNRDANLSVNWKIMGATPDTSVTVNGSNDQSRGGATIVHVWRGADSGTPIDVTTTTAIGNNGARPDSPSITPTTSGAVVLTVGCGTSDGGGVAFANPNGYGNVVTALGDSTSIGIVAVAASKAWSGSGAEDPGAWTGGESGATDSWAAATVAIRPSTQSGYTISAESTNTPIAGTAASLEKGFAVAAEAGAAPIAGTAAALKKAYPLGAESGSASIAGTAATLFAARKVAADTASVPITGTDASLARAFTLAADGGSVPITGADASLEHSYTFTAESASVPITGTAATLTKSGGNTTLTADPGELPITGTDASLKAGRRLEASAGSTSIAGADASLEKGSRLDAQAGSVPITGAVANLTATRLLSAASGGIDITGSAATLLTARKLIAESGAAQITGANANLNWSGATQSPSRLRMMMRVGR